MDHSSGGFLFGADAEVQDGWRVGLLAGYGHSSFSADGVRSSGNADSYHLGAYAGRQFGPIGLRTGATYAWHDVSTTRSVTIGSFTDTLTADYAAATAQVFGEAGYTLDTAFARFEPFAGLALVHQHNDGFSESGGAAALTVSSASQTLGVTTLGARAERQFAATGTLTASLAGTLGWRHAIGDVSAGSTMRFAGGDAFTITGAPIDRDTALIEAGLKLGLGDNARLDISYQGELGARAQDHGVKAGFSARF
ncbi:autotransporter domain-containing protein [Breoghania sp. L-A4]|uniref:autotransporter outer membrane beta-barrel domain-containing protein n=1 Tax=Breoghania sp. L-A4 TaxID=2304600 RepID=UPI0013C347CD|nr:autotransporter domain-containing protein [Breoghania sp. L-A4]